MKRSLTIQLENTQYDFIKQLAETRYNSSMAAAIRSFLPKAEKIKAFEIIPKNDK